MASLTIKNLPDRLYEALKRSATRHRRSLNSEVIVRLEEAVGARALDPAEWLASARAARERVNVWLTDEDLRAMKDDGRA